MATDSSTLAWQIPWMEEPGRLQSMGSLRVRHDWATSLSLSCIGEGNGNPLQCSCLENPRGGWAWWAAVYGVTQSRTWLKWVSSSSSSRCIVSFHCYFCLGCHCPLWNTPDSNLLEAGWFILYYKHKLPTISFMPVQTWAVNLEYTLFLIPHILLFIKGPENVLFK